MAQQFKFWPEQAKTIAKLINNLCVTGSQIMQMDRPAIWHKACETPRELRNNNRDLVKMLDGIGQSLKEEKISSVIDNLDQRANDAAGILSLTRRCLNSCAFLAHCVATCEITLVRTMQEDEAAIIH